ncbi:uncharacterized protein Tco025E_09561, partial [Trypanosoma conorhini]
TAAPVLQNDSQRPDKAQLRLPAAPQCSMKCVQPIPAPTSCVRCPPGVPGRSPTVEELQAAATTVVTAHSREEDVAGWKLPSNIAAAAAKQRKENVSASTAETCVAGGPKDPPAPCDSGLPSAAAAAASCSHAGVGAPPLSGNERCPTPSGRVAQPNPSSPAFSHLSGGGAGVVVDGVPGAAPAGPNPTSLRPDAGHPSREEAASKGDAGMTAGRGSNADAVEPGGVPHTGVPISSADRRGEGGGAPDAAAGTVPSAQTSSVGSAGNKATTAEEAAPVSQGQSGVPSADAAAPAAPAQKGSRTEATDAAGATVHGGAAKQSADRSGAAADAAPTDETPNAAAKESGAGPQTAAEEDGGHEAPSNAATAPTAPTPGWPGSPPTRDAAPHLSNNSTTFRNTTGPYKMNTESDGAVRGCLPRLLLLALLGMWGTTALC